LPFFILCTVLFATKLAKINQSSKSFFYLLMLYFVELSLVCYGHLSQASVAEGGEYP